MPLAVEQSIFVKMFAAELLPIVRFVKKTLLAEVFPRERKLGGGSCKIVDVRRCVIKVRITEFAHAIEYLLPQYCGFLRQTVAEQHQRIAQSDREKCSRSLPLIACIIVQTSVGAAQIEFGPIDEPLGGFEIALLAGMRPERGQRQHQIGDTAVNDVTGGAEQRAVEIF